ncbi:MAG: RNase adapter RapZ [Myxococcota bacterium]
MIALSGLSGAGKSTAAKALEDLGYFVVDNLPAELLLKFAELGQRGHETKPLAFVIDAREAEHLTQFTAHWSTLKDGALWFLEASEQTLVRRFQETRRPHPIDKSGQGILASIQTERALLAPLRSVADRVIETDSLTPHQLRAEIGRLIGAPTKLLTAVRLISFGFKHGLPQELDLCLDVRFLENPYFIEGLKEQTGLDQAVKEFVLYAPKTKPFLEKTLELLRFLIPCYQSENKTYLTIAIGCTGGKHRSVVLVGEMARQLERYGYPVQITHRDCQK